MDIALYAMRSVAVATWIACIVLLVLDRMKLK
jgi:hypothetical protein